MKDPTVLINNLTKIVGYYNDTPEVIKKMQQVYVDKKMDIMSVGLIFKGDIPLDGLRESELGVWCIFLHSIIEDEDDKKLIDPEDYFTDGEIMDYKTYVERNEFEMRKTSITLKNVIKLIENGKVEYRCMSLGCGELHSINLSKLLTYNFNTQRDAKIVKYKGKSIKQANINRESTEQMKQLMLNGRWQGNMLSFNLRVPSNHKVEEMATFKEYVPGTNIGDLTITPNPDEGLCWDIVDGQHRVTANGLAMEEALREGKKLDHSFIIKIPQFTEDEAQDFIHIQNQQNSMDKEHSQSYSKNDINTFIMSLNKCGTSSTNEMNGRVYNTLDELRMYSYGYTTVSILYAAFRLSGLKFNRPKKREEYQEHFIVVFNEILGEFLDQYEDDTNKLKKETIVLEPNMFVGYVALGTELLEKENKKQILRSLIRSGKLDLSRNKMNWEEIDMFGTPKSYSKIYEYFKKLIREVE